MPIYSSFFLFFTFANIAMPGTSSFIGEFLILCGVYKTNIVTCLLSVLAVVICAIYSLWLYNRLVFGNLKISYTKIFRDLNFREFVILCLLSLFIFFLGVYPAYILKSIEVSVLNLILLT